MAGKQLQAAAWAGLKGIVQHRLKSAAHPKCKKHGFNRQGCDTERRCCWMIPAPGPAFSSGNNIHPHFLQLLGPQNEQQRWGACDRERSFLSHVHCSGLYSPAKPPGGFFCINQSGQVSSHGIETCSDSRAQLWAVTRGQNYCCKCTQAAEV